MWISYTKIDTWNLWFGLNNEWYGCDGFVRGILECGGEVEKCVIIVSTVSLGWTAITGSVVVVRKTVHWLENKEVVKTV